MSYYGQIQFNMKDGVLQLDHLSLHDDKEAPIESKTESNKGYTCVSFSQAGQTVNLFFRNVDELVEWVRGLGSKAEMLADVEAEP